MEADRDPRPVVLVVDPSGEERTLARDWLRAAGMRAIQCVGPGEPELVCAWVGEGRCPLPSEADVVVLNLWLESDTLMRGTSAGELLTYYRALDRPVVGLLGWGEPAPLASDDDVVFLPHPVSRDELVRAVRQLLPLTDRTER